MGYQLVLKRLPVRISKRLQELWPRQQKPTPRVMAAYQRWQQQFFYQRSGLLIEMILLVLASVTVAELFRVFGISRDGPLEDFRYTPHEFVGNAVIAAVLLLGLGMRKTRWGKRHAEFIFVFVSVGINLTSFLERLVVHESIDEMNIAVWTIVFLSQAAIVPVRWQLHLKAQVTALIPVTLVFAIVLLFGDEGTNRYAVISSMALLYVYFLWISFIADLAVYLYERLRYSEFEARQTIQTFLHAVSHDLRNPVTGMQMFLKSLMEQADQTKADVVTLPRSSIDQMLQGGDRQLSLINSLLEAHGNPINTLALNWEAIPLQRLIDGLHQDLNPLLQTSQATLLNQVNAKLPDVYGDRAQLWRVFQNLVTNAVQHNLPEVTIRIQAAVKMSAKPQIYCTVSDDGIGMDTEDCEYLFDLYTQGRRHRRHLSAGLGLYIARQIIEAHGGKLGVESKPNQGCRFWLTLPIASTPS
ncbi:MAG: HAMP domain-containing sensor histidine kinase, partial [Cyanobacteria bacterium P01_C01_bin.73]